MARKYFLSALIASRARATIRTGAHSLWEKMGQASQNGTPAYLSTHPSSRTRLEDLRLLLPRVLPPYEAAARH
jgi:hypothetical protein